MNKEERKINGVTTELYYSFKSKISANEFFFTIRGNGFIQSRKLQALEDALNDLELEEELQTIKRLSETC